MRYGKGHCPRCAVHMAGAVRNSQDLLYGAVLFHMQDGQVGEVYSLRHGHGDGHGDIQPCLRILRSRQADSDGLFVVVAVGIHIYIVCLRNRQCHKRGSVLGIESRSCHGNLTLLDAGHCGLHRYGHPRHPLYCLYQSRHLRVGLHADSQRRFVHFRQSLFQRRGYLGLLLLVRIRVQLLHCCRIRLFNVLYA